MSKLLKYTFYLVSLLVVLFIALVIAVSVLVDPNDYKGELTDKVQQATGRSLTIEGDLSLSFFPWFGIEIGKTELGNAPGFDGKVFAKIDQVAVNVQVLPLLRKQLVIDEIVLDGLSVHLMRNAQGKTNWDDLISATEAKKKSPRNKPSEKNFQKEMQEHHEGMGDMMKGLDIGGIRISNASLEWVDLKNKVGWSLNYMNLNVGAVATDKPIPIKLSVVATDKNAAKEYPLSLSTVMTMNYERHQMQFSDLELSLADLTLKGQISMSGEELQMKGKLASNEFVPKDLLAGLGIKLPATQDGTVFGKASVATEFSMAPNSLLLDNFVLKLDDTSVQGNVKVGPLSPAGIHFELSIDELDADRYLPPAPGATGKQAAQQHSKAAASEDAPLPIPVEMLRGLDLRGQLKIGKLKAYGIRSSDIRISLSADKGLVKISPATAKLYDGIYAGDIKINVRGKTPVFSINEKLTGIQAEPLLKDVADIKLLSGRADTSAKVTTRGNSIAQLRKGMNGKMSFSFTDGAIQGANIAHMLRKANATLTGAPQPPDEPEKTDFTSLTGTAKIVNGVIQNNDLLATSPLLRITGIGQIDLVREIINYRVETVVVATLEGQGGASMDKLKGVPIPVKITGPLRDPKFKVELGKVLTKQQKAKLKKKIDKEKDKARQKLNKKLKDLLKF